MEYLKPIIQKILNLSLDFLVPCFITLALFVFIPCLRNWAGAEKLYMEYRPWISLLMIYCGVCILYRISGKIIARTSRAMQVSARETDMLFDLVTLPPAEQEILRRFVEAGTDVIWLPIENFAVTSLKASGVIKQVTYERTYQGPYRAALGPGYEYRLNPKLRLFIHQLFQGAPEQLP